jgi:hypothetical protein
MNNQIIVYCLYQLVNQPRGKPTPEQYVPVHCFTADVTSLFIFSKHLSRIYQYIVKKLKKNFLSFVEALLK